MLNKSQVMKQDAFLFSVIVSFSRRQHSSIGWLLSLLLTGRKPALGFERELAVETPVAAVGYHQLLYIVYFSCLAVTIMGF